jgi:hypothetical protein
MDAFQQAVEDARRELIRQEGRNVSQAEIIRRAGLESRRATVARHFNPNISWPKGHRVPADIIRALAPALKVPEAELMKAAHTAAGYPSHAEDRVDLGYEVARFLGDEEVSPEEKAALRVRLLQIIQEDLARSSNGE